MGGAGTHAQRRADALPLPVGGAAIFARIRRAAQPLQPARHLDGVARMQPAEQLAGRLLVGAAHQQAHAPADRGLAVGRHQVREVQDGVGRRRLRLRQQGVVFLCRRETARLVVQGAAQDRRHGARPGAPGHVVGSDHLPRGVQGRSQAGHGAEQGRELAAHREGGQRRRPGQDASPERKGRAPRQQDSRRQGQGHAGQGSAGQLAGQRRHPRTSPRCRSDVRTSLSNGVAVEAARNDTPRFVQNSCKPAWNAARFSR